MTRIGTLFSGGLAAPEQALKQLNIPHKNVFACEFDKFARQNYIANHDIDEKHFHEDINDMDGKQYAGQVDIIIGGSPCQAFSLAGLRKGLDDKRGQLIWQYFRIISEVRPNIFIYENVKGMLSDNGGKTFKDFIEVFRSVGYHCHFSVLNTKDYGVPQNRERAYIIGFLDYEKYLKFQFAEKKPVKKGLGDVLEECVDEKYYLKDNTIGSIIRIMGKKKGYARIVDKNTASAKTLTARMYVSYNADYIQEPTIIQKARGYNNGGVHRISPPITSSCWHENNILNYKNRLRKLTPRECFRLQGCDDSFRIAVSDSQAYKIAGNAMSVNVLEMIFDRILYNYRSTDLMSFAF